LVGAAIGPAGHDLIPFSDHVVDRKLAWQGGEEAREVLFVFLSAINATCVPATGASGIMEDKVRGALLVNDSNVIQVEAVKETADESLVVFS
jgi:hypothetical protein